MSAKSSRRKRPDCVMETFPCGCSMGQTVENGVNTMVFEPHSTSCEYYLYFVAQSKALGHPIELRSVD